MWPLKWLVGIYLVYSFYSRYIFCQRRCSIVATPLQVSLFCTWLLFFDRYIAVSHVLRYHQSITTARIMYLSSVLVYHLKKERIDKLSLTELESSH